MKDLVVIDANLLLLLIVGISNRKYIKTHKNCSEYTDDDFDLLVEIIGDFSEIILLPHILTEVSNLARQTSEPAKSNIQRKLKEFVENYYEVQVNSLAGVQREEFCLLGLTDSVILVLCTMNIRGLRCTLLTADRPLANQAMALGYDAILYSDFFC